MLPIIVVGFVTAVAMAIAPPQVQDQVAYAKTLKVYRLSEASNPPQSTLGRSAELRKAGLTA